MNEKTMSFLGHLEELRKAILKSFVSFAIGTIACLFFSPQLYKILKAPLQKVLPKGSFFIATTPFESYAAYFKISLVFGLFLSSPFIFYFIWSFIRPGLAPRERRKIVPVALICALLFTGGALFGYFLVFPTGFHFVVGILEGSDTVLLPKMNDYLSFAFFLLLAFGLSFELPLFLWLLGKFGLVKAEQLRRSRKYAVVLIFLIAGVLTPGPDVPSQLMMAAPLLVLFEVGILLVRLAQRGREPSESPPVP